MHCKHAFYNNHMYVLKALLPVGTFISKQRHGAFLKKVCLVLV